MQLALLGLVFVIGLFIYYLYSTSGSSSKKPGGKGERKNKPIDEDLERKENVIFLPDDVEKVKERHKKGKK